MFKIQVIFFILFLQTLTFGSIVHVTFTETYGCAKNDRWGLDPQFPGYEDGLQLSEISFFDGDGTQLSISSITATSGTESIANVYDRNPSTTWFADDAFRDIAEDCDTDTVDIIAVVSGDVISSSFTSANNYENRDSSAWYVEVCDDSDSDCSGRIGFWLSENDRPGRSTEFAKNSLEGYYTVNFYVVGLEDGDSVDVQSVGVQTVTEVGINTLFYAIADGDSYSITLVNSQICVLGDSETQIVTGTINGDDVYNGAFIRCNEWGPPTNHPTTDPSFNPSFSTPTASPSFNPSVIPTFQPSDSPTISSPTVIPTVEPSDSPSTSTTQEPSNLPTTSDPSTLPSAYPTPQPTVSITFLSTRGCDKDETWNVDYFGSSLQLSEITFWDAEMQEVPYDVITATPPNTPDGEGPHNLYDGSSNTKFVDAGWQCDDHTVTLDIEISERPWYFAFRTANDNEYRDPTRWLITLADYILGDVTVPYQENDPPSERHTRYPIQSLEIVKIIFVIATNLNSEVSVTNVATITIDTDGTYKMPYGLFEGDYYYISITGNACVVPDNYQGTVGDYDIYINLDCTLQPTAAPTTSTPTHMPSISIPTKTPSLRPTNFPSLNPLPFPRCENTNAEQDITNWLTILGGTAQRDCTVLFGDIFQTRQTIFSGFTVDDECQCFDYVTEQDADSLFMCYPVDNRDLTIYERWLVCQPTNLPTVMPSDGPTITPSDFPTEDPTTSQPSDFPTSTEPTEVPSPVPSNPPTTTEPSLVPTDRPSFAPIVQPTFNPTTTPSEDPSTLPTELPSISIPSSFPSLYPTQGQGFSFTFLYTQGCVENDRWDTTVGFESGIQLGEIHLYNQNGELQAVSGVSAPFSQSPSAYPASNLFDNNYDTKWYDQRFTQNGLDSGCDNTVRITADSHDTASYELYTSTDTRNRDPVRWNAMYCDLNDFCQKLRMDVGESPTTRKTLYGTFSFEPIDVYADVQGLANGESITISNLGSVEADRTGLIRLDYALSEGDSYSVETDGNCFPVEGSGTATANMDPITVRCNTGYFPCTEEDYEAFLAYSAGLSTNQYIACANLVTDLYGNGLVDGGCDCFVNVPAAEAERYLGCFADDSDQLSLYDYWGSCRPSHVPTPPTLRPTDTPSISSPTTTPSYVPTDVPTTSTPTTIPSDSPSDVPTFYPTSSRPTASPSSSEPSLSPSKNPTVEPVPYVMIKFTDTSGCERDRAWGLQFYNSGFKLSQLSFFDSEAQVVATQNLEQLTGNEGNLANLVDGLTTTDFYSSTFDDDLCENDGVTFRMDVPLEATHYNLWTPSDNLYAFPIAWDLSRCLGQYDCRTVSIFLDPPEEFQTAYGLMTMEIFLVNVQVINMFDTKGLTATFTGEILAITENGDFAFTKGVANGGSYLVAVNAPHFCVISGDTGVATGDVQVVVDCTTEEPTKAPTVFDCQYCGSLGDVCEDSCDSCNSVCAGETRVDSYTSCAALCPNPTCSQSVLGNNGFFAFLGLEIELACLTFLTQGFDYATTCRQCMNHVDESAAYAELACIPEGSDVSLLATWRLCNDIFGAPSVNPTPLPSKKPTQCPDFSCDECGENAEETYYTDAQGCSVCSCRSFPTSSPTTSIPTFTPTFTPSSLPSKRPSSSPTERCAHVEPFETCSCSEGYEFADTIDINTGCVIGCSCEKPDCDATGMTNQEIIRCLQLRASLLKGEVSTLQSELDSAESDTQNTCDAAYQDIALALETC